MRRPPPATSHGSRLGTPVKAKVAPVVAAPEEDELDELPDDPGVAPPVLPEEALAVEPEDDVVEEEPELDVVPAAGVVKSTTTF